MNIFFLGVLGVILVVVGVFLFTALFGAPYVPSFEKEVGEAFRRLKPLKESDVVVDLGAGDGVILRTAIKCGAGRAVGFEINPILAVIAWWRNRKESRIKIRCGNMNWVKFPEDMTVVYVFGLDRVMKMIKPRLEKYTKEHKRDIFVVSKAFEFSGMKAEKKNGAFYLYRIKP